MSPVGIFSSSMLAVVAFFIPLFLLGALKFAQRPIQNAITTEKSTVLGHSIVLLPVLE